MSLLIFFVRAYEIGRRRVEAVEDRESVYLLIDDVDQASVVRNFTPNNVDAVA